MVQNQFDGLFGFPGGAHDEAFVTFEHVQPVLNVSGIVAEAGRRLQGDIVCVSDGDEVAFAVEKNADYESIWQGADSYVSVLPPAYEEAEKQDSSASVYNGNKKTKKFHYASCSSVKDMKEKNMVELNTREDAIEKGYVPCKNCNP